MSNPNEIPDRPLTEQEQRALEIFPVLVQVPCTSPACRGRRNGGAPFMAWTTKGSEANAQCNECFSR